MSVEIRGSRIVLRDWRLEDLEVYARWLSPGHEWQRLDGPYYPKPGEVEIEEILARRKRWITSPEGPDWRGGMVISPSDNEAMIGMVSRYWESRETNWLCVGLVVFDPSTWRHGIGYEALGLWSDYLFQDMPEIVRLDLRTWSGNVGMMRLAEKLGYREEARFRKARIVDGRYYDGMGYGVLREEWEALYPGGFTPKADSG